MRYQVKDQGKLPAKFKWPIWCKIWFFTSLVCFILTLVTINLFKKSELIVSLGDQGWLLGIVIALFISCVTSVCVVPANLQQNYEEHKKIIQLLSQGPKTAEEIHNALQPDPTVEIQKKLAQLARKGLVIIVQNGMEIAA